MKKTRNVCLLALALLLSVGAVLLLTGCQPQAAEPAPAAPTVPPIRELSFTTETLPEPSALAAYPDLKKLDVTACQQVTATWYEAIRQAVPPDCQVLWAVPLTDGRFPAESTRLKLPHFSPEDGTLIPYFPQLTAVDASGSAAYDALLALKDARPDLDLTFTLPVGDQVLTMDDESLTVTEAPDFALLGKALGAFPRLRTLDLTAAPVAPTDAVALSDLYPELAVSYTVPVGSLRFSPDATAIALEGSSIQTVQELLDALPYLPGLQQADLHGTGLGLNDVMALQAARPSLVLSQTVELLDRSVELNAEELDLRNATVPTADLVSLLHPFTALKKVYLPQTEDVEATAVRLQSEHPETVFIRRVTVFGQTIMNDVEELDVSKTPFRTTEEVLSQLSQLPYLKKLVMCDCGLSDEQMEELMAARSDVRFVWNVQIGPHTLRTDDTVFSTLNPSKHISARHSKAYKNWIKTCVRLQPGDLAPLKYCTDLMALDLGHNYLTSADLEVLPYLPHLQVLILVDNDITDISALAYLKELRFLELFMNDIPDMSPLVGLPELKDVNICRTNLKDIGPLLQLTQVERLWFSKNGLTAAQNKAVVAALPNCKCNWTAKGSTDEGWREHERYKWAKALFPEAKMP